MRKDKQIAIKLRRQNKSYNEISKMLGISKGTLSAWFINDRLSQKTKKELTKLALINTLKRVNKWVATNKARWREWRKEAREEAINEFPKLCHNQLFIAGLMLYWAEGDNKLGNPVRFTNTDPRMIRLYIQFLLRILKIKKETVRPALILYPDLEENNCLEFWSKITTVPVSQFYKTQFIKGRHKTARLSDGICMITCGNRQLKEKFIIWIDLLSKRL